MAGIPGIGQLTGGKGGIRTSSSALGRSRSTAQVNFGGFNERSDQEVWERIAIGGGILILVGFVVYQATRSR